MIFSVETVTKGGRRRLFTKARASRSGKHFYWTLALYDDLLVEFERLQKLGMNFSTKTLTAFANHLSGISTKDSHSATTPSGKNYHLITGLVTASWIQRFMEKSSIVLRRQTGKLHLLPQAQEVV